jgi:hypothetical protein
MFETNPDARTLLGLPTSMGNSVAQKPSKMMPVPRAQDVMLKASMVVMMFSYFYFTTGMVEVRAFEKISPGKIYFRREVVCDADRTQSENNSE